MPTPEQPPGGSAGAGSEGRMRLSTYPGGGRKTVGAAGICWTWSAPGSGRMSEQSRRGIRRLNGSWIRNYSRSLHFGRFDPHSVGTPLQPSFQANGRSSRRTAGRTEAQPDLSSSRTSVELVAGRLERTGYEGEPGMIEHTETDRIDFQLKSGGCRESIQSPEDALFECEQVSNELLEQRRTSRSCTQKTHDLDRRWTRGRQPTSTSRRNIGITRT